MAVCVYDFTIPEKSLELSNLKSILTRIAKKWTFQLEEGSQSGYRHYQGRMSLKVKARMASVKDALVPEVHLSPTSSANRDNMFYVMKDETRVEGPWSDSDDYVPKRFQGVPQWRPWQKQVYESIMEAADDRKVNVIVDPKGNNGKTFLAMWLLAHKKAMYLPPMNDIKDMMRAVMDMEKHECYILDLPRAMPKKNLRGAMAAIEQLKNGYAYDDRYSFRYEQFEPPHIWVFSNVSLDTEYLSVDRWRVWSITPDQTLEEVPALALTL